MKTILRGDVYENKILIKDFDNDFKSDYVEKTININKDIAKGVFKEYQMTGFRIITRDLKIDNLKLSVEHDFPLFKLHFEIEGSNNYIPDNSLETNIYIPNGHYNLFYLPVVKGVLEYNTKSRKTLEVIFTELYIKKTLGNNYKKFLLEFGKAIDTENPFILWEKSKPITSKLLYIINEITSCNYDKDFKKAFLEIKVKELLIELLSKTNEELYGTDYKKLNTTDYNRIIKIESFLKENLHKKITIPELGKIGGVNTSKLKEDFKTVFLTTIFKHITLLRMEKSKELITEDVLSISEISVKVGYKNPQHFTTAFKKIYGYPPSKLKQEIK